MTAWRLRIARRFRGPPDSGNGGYVCGLLAERLAAPVATVTLRRPPPLERELDIVVSGAGLDLLDGDLLIASAEPAALELEVTPPPTSEAASSAAGSFAGFDRHAFPGCFVCGPERGHVDGLGIFAGVVGHGQVAAEWVPHASLAGEDGGVGPTFLWAALDCPGYWSVADVAGVAMLGRMTARIDAAVQPGEPLIVTGWPIERDGRKHHVGTALHRPDGTLVACARATWIAFAALD